MMKRPDLIMHFSICFLITLNCITPFWIAIVLAAFLGIGKELYDKYIKKTFWDWGDIFSDALGICIGIIIRLLFI